MSQRATTPESASADTSNNRMHSFMEKVSDYTSRPLFDYHSLLFITAMLTGFGLVMVLSSSMAISGDESGSVWAIFLRQAIMVAVGLVLFALVLRMRIDTVRSLATPSLVVSFGLLFAVLAMGVGLEEVGAQSWLAIGPVNVQPSEFAKIALALWGSKHLAQRMRTARTQTELYGLYAVVSGVILVLVILQRDLGMAASIAIVVMLLALFSGLPWRIFAGVCGAASVFFVFFVLLEGFRSQRIMVFVDTLFGRFTQTQASGYQSYQGVLSLADGSLTGVGLGQSRAKWFYLPEAKNDFIFAIIGEETGFFGAALVILFYAALGWVGLRIAMKQADPFLKLLAATLTTGTVIQAFINIGYVVGLLPVTGLQLPLISAGGTSAVVTLAAMGLLATCARHEPEAVSAIQTSGPPLIDRWLALPEPLPYEPSRTGTGASRAHRQPQRFGRPVTRPDEDELSPQEFSRQRRNHPVPEPAGQWERRSPRRSPSRAGREAARESVRDSGRRGQTPARQPRSRGDNRVTRDALNPRAHRDSDLGRDGRGSASRSRYGEVGRRSTRRGGGSNGPAAGPDRKRR
ncbi:putative lipid II flippase FtsW [Corynebacterium sp. TAE3-ERU12]|uniref:putative lipid II flippase FtsW n=1 Tax=Corynebacterium sp. TAE3-ERU12 TaxID=2849491 RepID=UPI001C47EC0A|nr:putative lipid II flippase FtsW [Corynebacterium sp. TAE3-ERU12]MBV7296222.1 putative lipid II flippase FtsW [Corynebacterium sp. TAE3-ERU12]